jgi:hypothetical protein
MNREDVHMQASGMRPPLAINPARSCAWYPLFSEEHASQGKQPSRAVRCYHAGTGPAAGLLPALSRVGSRVLEGSFQGPDHRRRAAQVGDGVFEVLSTSGDTHLGGDDFDKRIVDFLAKDFQGAEGIDLRKDRQALQRLMEASEKAKMELSTLSQARD